MQSGAEACLLLPRVASTGDMRVFCPFCRLGVSSEEETKATLPTLAPDSLPAYLSVHHISSDNNPFVSKMGQKVPDSEGVTSASLPSPFTDS